MGATVSKTFKESAVSAVASGSDARTAPDDAAAWGLDPRLLTALTAAGLSRFFPIQAAVIPHVLSTEREHDTSCGDICISAPTGSGKTIAYAVPIVQVRVFHTLAYEFVMAFFVASSYNSFFGNITKTSNLFYSDCSSQGIEEPRTLSCAHTSRDCALLFDIAV